MKPRYRDFLLVSSLCLLAFSATGRAASADCHPAGFTRYALLQLKTHEFEIADDATRNALALGLARCLSDPDPEIRDAIAFEALSHFMRQRQLSERTMTTLERDLERKLGVKDRGGFQQPFAALALSEIARADRVQAYMTPEMRSGLLAVAITYFTNLRDYRGFDSHAGWRHGVAHGADLLLQLSLNPLIGRLEINRILEALATQIAPIGHFYTYGEPERLARPVVAIASRDLLTEAEWTAWLARVAAPAPLPSWMAAFSSQTGLARHHDVSAFISRVYVEARLTSNRPVEALFPGAEKALASLP